MLFIHIDPQKRTLTTRQRSDFIISINPMTSLIIDFGIFDYCFCSRSPILLFILFANQHIIKTNSFPPCVYVLLCTISFFLALFSSTCSRPILCLFQFSARAYTQPFLVNTHSVEASLFTIYFFRECLFKMSKEISRVFNL